MNSVLHQKIVGNSSFGDRMPKGGGNLAQADEEKIKKWIDEGALQSWNGGADSETLTFNYTVASGDTTADLDYTSTNALELNS